MSEAQAQEKEVVKKESKGLIKLGVTRQALSKFKKKYAVVPDATTKEGYQKIVEFKRVAVPLRTKSEKEAKIQKEAAQQHINGINEELKFIVEAVKEVETPWYDAKKSEDERVEREKQEAIEKEEKRIAEIEVKVNHIESLTEGLLGADLDLLNDRMEQARAIDINDDYAEFQEAAKTVLGQVMPKLQAAIDERVQYDTQQANIKREKEEADERQRKMDEQQREIDEQKAALDLQKAEQEKPEVVEPEAAEVKPEETKPAPSGHISSAVQAKANEDDSVVAMARSNTLDALACVIAENDMSAPSEDAERVLDAICSGNIPNIKYSIY